MSSDASPMGCWAEFRRSARTVVTVPVEVLVMLSLVAGANRTRHWFLGHGRTEPVAETFRGYCQSRSISISTPA